MTDFLLSYLPILIFAGIAAVIGIALMASAFVLAPNNPDTEKTSIYECGFPAFDDA
ncbi:MAG: NADH-quinone oxidoreductase subunit A, partial [Hyphomicrobiales bacterium]|nr:NADH-quinone oxidoreductase subunit A [Hyphomicrobiales bacterium]